MIELSAMFPVLVAEDLSALKNFYQQYFGFQAEFFDAEFYVHLLHAGSGTQIAFMAPNHPSQPEFLHALASTEGMVISFEVPSVKSAYDLATKAGLEIAFDYKVEDFGVTHFMVRDPAGFLVDVVEHHAQQ